MSDESWTAAIQLVVAIRIGTGFSHNDLARDHNLSEKIRNVAALFEADLMRSDGHVAAARRILSNAVAESTKSGADE